MMDSIDILVNEHRNIKRMLVIVRKLCYEVLKNEPVDYDDFFKVIDFIRTYSDHHHHGKEEEILFELMLKELGPVAEKLIKQGMYVEHDLGRLHTQEMEAALKRVIAGDEEAKLDLIANAISYAHLLNRHIDKEDNAVYVFARKNLKQEALAKLEEDSRAFESNADENQVQAKYLKLLEDLESKYIKL